MGTASSALAHDGDRSSDHELVRLVRRGDERAFELLYDRYQRRIAASGGAAVAARRSRAPTARR